MKHVLAIDGGGIKGYLAARLLEADPQPADLYVGTSTGGILALASAFEIAPGRIASLYRGRGPEIFSASLLGAFSRLWRPKYRPNVLRNALYDVFGDATMGDAVHPVMVTTYDLVHGRSYLIKSWKADRAMIPVVDAALATSAAPTFFPPHRIGGLELVDGGVFANSPGWIALTEARKLWPGQPIQMTAMGFGGRQGVAGRPGASAGWGLLQWVSRLAPVFMGSVADTTDYALKMELGGRYRRIAPDALDIAMDDCSEASFLAMDHAVASMGVAA